MRDYLSRSPRIGDDVRLDVPVLLRRGFLQFRPTRRRGTRSGRKTYGSAPSKIIPWSVSWHPMIVRQRLESVGLSLGVHVRLARVSCGATLPSPGCLQDCNIVSGRGRVKGRDGKGKGRRGCIGEAI